MEEYQTAPDRSIQIAVPNSTAALVLGIISIPMCCCCGWWSAIVGVILGIIGIVLAGQAIREYYNRPDLYTLGSLKNAQAGRVCAIIGLVLSALVVIFFLVLVITGQLSELEMLQEQFLEEYYDQYY